MRELLVSWIGRGWLQIGPGDRGRAGLQSIDELLPHLDQHGPSIISLKSDLPLPEVDLTEQAFDDVKWLRGKV